MLWLTKFTFIFTVISETQGTASPYVTHIIPFVQIKVTAVASEVWHLEISFSKTTTAI